MSGAALPLRPLRHREQILCSAAVLTEQNRSAYRRLTYSVNLAARFLPLLICPSSKAHHGTRAALPPIGRISTKDLADCVIECVEELARAHNALPRHFGGLGAEITSWR
jgi:hypothetical protein